MSVKSQPQRRTQAQRREATQQKIMASACTLFGEKGYEQTSLEDIARDAGITIGPIYHYYDNKLQLFRFVNRAMEDELVSTLKTHAEAIQQSDFYPVWEAFLSVARKPGFAQIVLLDAPHILGRDNWLNSPVLALVYELMTGKPKSDDPQDTEDLNRELFIRMLTASLAEIALMIGKHPDFDSSPIVTRLLSTAATVKFGG